MTPEDRLHQHLELCDRIYRRLVAEGKWPWPDSPDDPLRDRVDPSTNDL